VTAPPLLDTHAWLWWLDGTGTLRPGERRALDDLAEAGHCPFLCAISLWEMALLVELGRVDRSRRVTAHRDTVGRIARDRKGTPSLSEFLSSRSG
jgi:PIN domain nuclease of toxin-antitoxin system